MTPRSGLLLPRRTFIRTAAGLSVAGLAHNAFSQSSLASSRTGICRDGNPAAWNNQSRFLIVLGAAGGAEILDSFLALTEAEVSAANRDASTFNCFPDANVVRIDGSPLRAIDIDTTIANLNNAAVKANQSKFLRKRFQETLVVPFRARSVNHTLAQKASITGQSAWNGRTIQECFALAHGSSFPIANVNMGYDGFAADGDDDSVAAFARAQRIFEPLLWPLALSAKESAAGGLPPEALDAARALRAELAKVSPKAPWMSASAPARNWTSLRDSDARCIEEARLSEKLYFGDLASPTARLDARDQRVLAAFPNFQADSLEAQAILAFRLLQGGVSSAVTLGPNFTGQFNSFREIYNVPVAFDNSHASHRGTQAFMWSKILGVVDRLADLLAAEPFMGTGESMWDRTTILITTEFGRERTRPVGSTSFGSSHDFETAAVVVSPKMNGNRVLGGVDPATGKLYGFDPRTGLAEKGRSASPENLFAGLVQALGADAPGSGLPTVAGFAH